MHTYTNSPSLYVYIYTYMYNTIYIYDILYTILPIMYTLYVSLNKKGQWELRPETRPARRRVESAPLNDDTGFKATY